MENKQKGLPTIVWIIILGIIIVLLAVTYYKDTQRITLPNLDEKTVNITIMVPNDMVAYEKAMNDYIFNGKPNPAKTWTFVPKTISIAATTDVIPASAASAAGEISTQGGARAARVEYLKVTGGTAYILLGMHLDGWAGVSVSLAKIEPLIEKTLLQFPGITSVKFTPAPGDSMDEILKEYISSTATSPTIESITPSSGPVGTTIEVKGQNLFGFESEPNAWLENSNGEKGYLGEAVSFNPLKLKIDSKLCKNNDSSTGVCNSYLTITPGKYKITAEPYGVKSNAVEFTVTSEKPSSQPDIKVISPNGGENWKIGQTYSISTLSGGELGTRTIRLNRYSDDGVRVGEITIGTTESDNFSYKIPVGTEQTTGSASRHKIQVIVNKYNTGKGVADESDNYFSITN